MVFLSNKMNSPLYLQVHRSQLAPWKVEEKGGGAKLCFPLHTFLAKYREAWIFYMEAMNVQFIKRYKVCFEAKWLFIYFSVLKYCPLGSNFHVHFQSLPSTFCLFLTFPSIEKAYPLLSGSLIHHLIYI